MAKESLDKTSKEVLRIKSLMERMHLYENGTVDHEKCILIEMAFQRKDFITQIVFLLPQIIQNWCLCHYATKNGLDEGLREHWGEELQTHLLNVASNKIKGNNSYDSRIKAFTEAWNRKEADTDPDVVNMLVITKFE